MVEDIAVYKICSQYSLRTHKGFAVLFFLFFSMPIGLHNTPVIHIVIQTYVHIITLHIQTHTRARARAQGSTHTQYIHTLRLIHTYIMISTTLYFFNVQCATKPCV